MSFTVSKTMARTQRPPIMQAQAWLRETTLPADLPLLNVSQAAPVAPPPEPLRAAMARFVMEDPDTHLYGPDLGLPALRAEIAAQWSRDYGGDIDADHVAITAGCNQAFAAAIATLAEAGDQIILPTPWYFNHKMWCDLSGVTAVPLPCGDGLIPDPAQAARLITHKTRAIVLVTPNNPCGTEYPAGVLDAFYDLAQAHGIALIVDETYRDFDAREGRPHDLFTRPDWADTLIHLYSFSKTYRLTGHRVGAMVCSPDRLIEVEKFIDSVTICPPQLGQRAALWGLQNLSDWCAGERAEILTRRAQVATSAAAQGDWTLLGLGAYFAYMQHPFDAPSDEVARAILEQTGVLMLPGTMFTPASDPQGKRQMRIAFANIDAPTITQMFDRLATFAP
ncbi:aminotransferase [Rhodovulum sp. FJ3]|uniref:aminotransferase n=1 Tax=Rhodovulum sp. FJ3 TaxID=3079053 RepID=UPI00293DC180|nr:aminotransferase [Rhodovulum sp. FJ3]MDV4166726.1 aminotransferase [Rhodovulum sp. FJ3]